jgi:hypothetical protein
MTAEESKAIELFQEFDSVVIALFICDEVISACEFNMVESPNTDWWNRVKDYLNKM